MPRRFHLRQFFERFLRGVPVAQSAADITLENPTVVGSNANKIRVMATITV
jgi:hypothetical protein